MTEDQPIYSELQETAGSEKGILSKENFQRIKTTPKIQNSDFKPVSEVRTTVNSSEHN